MRHVVYRPEAVLDLHEASERIAEYNLDAAIRFCLAIEFEERRLVEFPGMGARRSFKNSSLCELRSWSIKGFRDYLIFYQQIPGGIEIVNIIHGARDLDALFDNR